MTKITSWMFVDFSIQLFKYNRLESLLLNYAQVSVMTIEERRMVERKILKSVCLIKSLKTLKLDCMPRLDCVFKLEFAAQLPNLNHLTYNSKNCVEFRENFLIFLLEATKLQTLHVTFKRSKFWNLDYFEKIVKIRQDQMNDKMLLIYDYLSAEKLDKNRDKYKWMNSNFVNVFPVVNTDLRKYNCFCLP